MVKIFNDYLYYVLMGSIGVVTITGGIYTIHNIKSPKKPENEIIGKINQDGTINYFNEENLNKFKYNNNKDSTEVNTKVFTSAYIDKDNNPVLRIDSTKHYLDKNNDKIIDEVITQYFNPIKNERTHTTHRYKNLE